MAEVIWAEPALHALEEITDYIALDNQAAAKKFVCKVFDKIELLEGNPKLECAWWTQKHAISKIID